MAPEAVVVDLEVAVVVEDTEVAEAVAVMVEAAAVMEVVIVNREAMVEVKEAMVAAVVDMAAADTPVVGGMVEESNKVRVAVADGSKCWGA